MERDQEERDAMRHIEERSSDPGRPTELFERSLQQARENEHSRSVAPDRDSDRDPRQLDHERYLAEEQKAFDRKMETVWDTKGLRPDEWSSIQGDDRVEERVNVLQRLENDLAFNIGRDQATIRSLSQLTEEEREKLDLVGVENPNWSGYANYEAGLVVIRDDKIESDDVRESLRAYFHENRHIDQGHAINEKSEIPRLEKEQHNQDRLHQKLMEHGERDYSKIAEAKTAEEQRRLYLINEQERDSRIEEAKCMERYEEYVRGERF